MALAAAVVLLMAAAAAWWWHKRRVCALKAAAADALDTVLGWAPEATRVLTAAERHAHATLMQALPQHIILAQVALARFIKVPSRNSYTEWLRRVGHLCADLVVCDAQFRVIAVVEMRASKPQHAGPRLDRRRERLARVLQAANIPLYAWTENATPSPAEVRRLFVHDDDAPIITAAGLAASVEPPVSGFGGLYERPAVGLATEVRDAPPSTWFDELDSKPVPLNSGRAASEA